MDTYAPSVFIGAIKCFGILCSSNPTTVITKYPQLMGVVYENLSNPDQTLRCLCVETLAFIASKKDALKELNKSPDSLKASIKTIGKLINSPVESEDSKGRYLESIAMIFCHNPADVEISMICEKLFHNLSLEPVNFLLDFAQQPFLQIRYGTLKVLRNVSSFPWVEQDMALCAGLLNSVCFDFLSLRNSTFRFCHIV